MDEKDRIRREMEKSAEDIAGRLMDIVNTMWTGEDTMEMIVNRILDSHRTLQQAFFGSFVLKFIEEVANKDTVWFDGRNDYMKSVCDMLAGKLVDDEFALKEDGKVRVLDTPCV